MFARTMLALALLVATVATRAAEQDHSAPINGIEMHYQDLGSGKPLVLLHGFGGCADTWRPFAAALSAQHRLIIVDLRGHGRSTNPGATFTHRRSASDVLALLDSLGVERFSAMGISSGGMTLLHMATRQPERIESMVLIGASNTFPPQARVIMQGASLENMPPPVQAMYHRCAARGEAQIRQLVTQFHDFHASHDDMNLAAGDLAKISARTLIVHGDRDPFFPLEIPVGIYHAIPKASLWIVPNGEHVPIYDDAVPFVATALQFVDAVAVAGRPPPPAK